MSRDSINFRYLSVFFMGSPLRLSLTSNPASSAEPVVCFTTERRSPAFMARKCVCRMAESTPRNKAANPQKTAIRKMSLTAGVRYRLNSKGSPINSSRIQIRRGVWNMPKIITTKNSNNPEVNFNIVSRSSRVCKSVCAVCTRFRKGARMTCTRPYTTPNAASARSGLLNCPRKKLMINATPFSEHWVIIRGQENFHMS